MGLKHSKLSRRLTGKRPSNAASSTAANGTAASSTAAGSNAAGASGAVDLMSLTQIENRAVGSLIGCMCGDVLGAGVEGWDAEQITDKFSGGVTDFLDTQRGYGCYTDDTQMTIALARSLVACGGRVDPGHAAGCYAAEFEVRRGYGNSAARILLDIQGGAAWNTVAQKYIPGGSFANGGAMRIAPVGLAYRDAPPEVLHAAVEEALACTHVHPLGVDGAFVQASAVAALSLMPLKMRADKRAPTELLNKLRGLARTQEMREKIDAIKDALAQLEALDRRADPLQGGWATYLTSRAWLLELSTVEAVAEGFQIKATDASACALLALCFHWNQPEAAIIAAVHYGGDTDTIAAMTGALVGALHGRMWIPKRWWDNLENGKAGRDELVELAVQAVRLTPSPPPPGTK